MGLFVPQNKLKENIYFLTVSLVASVEGRLSNEHLVEQNPVAPPVHAIAVLQPLDDLQHGSIVAPPVHGAAVLQPLYDLK